MSPLRIVTGLMLVALGLHRIVAEGAAPERTAGSDRAAVDRRAPAARSIVQVPAGDWPPPDFRVTWTAGGGSGASPARSTQHVRILGFNDFHGNLEPPAIEGRPAGGAAVLAAYLEAAEREAPDRTLIVHAGDLLGASPPITRLNRNEPAIEFLDLLANDHCEYGLATHFFDAASWRAHPDRCNVIGTLGNHEFDAGPGEIARLLGGGNAPDGPFVENPWRGSRVPYVCANVRDRRTGRLILPPYAVAVVGGIPIGIIGVVVRSTPTMTPAGATDGLEFLDEADSINRAAAELEGHGIHTILVTIHQGVAGTRTPSGWRWDGPLRGIVARLDPDIDVVISGHTHRFTNALLPDRAGRPVLVTQASFYGIAFAQIDLLIDPATREIISKSARIIPTWNDVGPGLHPDPRVEALTAAARRAIASRIDRRPSATSVRGVQ